MANGEAAQAAEARHREAEARARRRAEEASRERAAARAREAEAAAREARAREAGLAQSGTEAQPKAPEPQPGPRALRPVDGLAQPGAEPRGVALTGGSIAPPTRIATTLLEAWVSREASDLESALKGETGDALPAARVQLVAGFWEAMVGSLEGAQDRFEAVRSDSGVSSEELALFEAALGAPGVRALPREASAPRGAPPLAHAMRMVLMENEARTLLKARHYKRAAVAWSDLVQLELRAPWAPHRETILEWGQLLEQAQGNHRLSARGEWPYVEEKVRNGDALTRIRKRVLKRRPDLLICTGLIEEVNDIQRYIQPGEVLRIPTDRANAVVDLDARLLLYRHGSEVVRIWPVGIGKPGHATPTGDFTVGDKLEDPTDWSKLLPPGAPGNDLGSRWLGLYRGGRKTSYGIHGTTDPTSIGGEVSLGCVRMRNEQVSELFEVLPQGAEVRIQD